jgi:hypothetical protein
MSVETSRFYVATNGNDTWSGTLDTPSADGTDGPFATLTRARDAVRQLKLAHGGGLIQAVEVQVRGGRYEMDEPLRLSGGDSGTAQFPVSYTAYPGESPVLSGGRRITGWRPYRDKIVCAELPKVRAGRWWFRQLFCNGKRMIRARYPKYDQSDPLYGGWAFVETAVPVSDELVATEKLELDPSWRFKIDPDKVGTADAWFATDTPDEDWDELSCQMPWQSQGYKQYHGSAWYRKRVVLPEGFDTRKRLFLLFGAADKEATVYIDGKKVCEHTVEATGRTTNVLWDDPFRFDVRDLLTPGREHVIAVRVDSEEHSGGLWRPVALVSAETDVSASLLIGVIEDPIAFRYESDTFPQRWAKPHQAEVFIIPGKSWISDIIPIKGVDFERRTIRLARPVGPSAHSLGAATHLVAGNRYYVENNLEDLTAPGEWCLDTDAGMIYFWPPDGDVETAEVAAPAVVRLLQIIGHRNAPVHHVTFKGLTFTQTQAQWPTVESYYKTPNAGQTVYLQDAEDCTIADNEFDAVGGDAIRLQDNNARIRITGNHIHDAGAYGIFVGGFQRGFSRHDSSSGDLPSPLEWHRDLEDRDTAVAAWPRSGEHLICNNHIHHVGYFEKHANGIAFFGISAPDVVVSHNLIHHTPRFGIGLMSGFGRVIIEYNEIHDVTLETCDTGGITANRWYTYDKDPDLSRGNIIRYNFIYDVLGCGAYGRKMEPGGDTKAGGRIWAPYYSWAIYFDNAPMDVLVYGNICARNTLGGIMISHYCKNVTIENNIFIDSDKSQAYLLFAGQMSNVRFRNNIFSYSKPDADYMRLNLAANIDLAAVITEHDHNLYDLPTGIALTFDGLPGEAVQRSGMATQHDVDTTMESWKALGFDAHSIIADPKFVDRANDNYNLQPDSPALKLGFKPIDTSRIGLCADPDAKKCGCPSK